MIFLILFGIRNILEIVPDIAQTTHGIRIIFADIRNVPTAVSCLYDLGERSSIFLKKKHHYMM